MAEPGLIMKPGTHWLGRPSPSPLWVGLSERERSPGHWPSAVGGTWELQERQHPCLEKRQPSGFLALAFGLGGRGWVLIQPRPGEGQSAEAELKWTVRS